MSARIAFLASLSCAIASVTSAAAQDVAFFEKKVLPVLQARCFECHSHEKKIKGGLTLDSRSGWVEGGDHGPAVVAGKPDGSLLIQMVRWSDDKHQMPPRTKLPADEIALLEDWVKRGAPDPRQVVAVKPGEVWWSFKPLPTQTPRGSVDAFITAKLREQDATMSAEADRRTLIRRLTFDLHGLPPTPEEVEAFVHDEAPDAYARLVDRLLASPRYGERFARHWLDVVHYGESNGFGMDRPRMNAWPYRDYVVRAFNDDKPYASFVQEQLAADALFPEQPALTPALGFVAAGPFNQSALVEQVDGTDCKKIALNLDRDDMVSSVAATFLSVTLHCARCHEHKFDPISQRDYYSMQAVFAGVVRGEREYDDDAARWNERQHWLAVRKRVEAGEPIDKLATADQERLRTRLAALEKQLRGVEDAWTNVQPKITTSSPKTTTRSLPDGSVRFEGEALDKDTYSLTIDAPMPRVAAVRIEVIADDALPHRGPGRQPSNGNLHLSEVTISAGAAVKIKQASADFDQAGWEAKKTIDSNPATAWGIHPQEGHSHAIVFTLEKPVTTSPLVVKLDQLHGQQHLIGRLRVSVSADANAKPGDPDLLATARAGRSNLKVVDDLIASLPSSPKVYAIGSALPKLRNYSPPAAPYPIHVLVRGDVNRPAVEVMPAGLKCVSTVKPTFGIDAKNEAQRRAALAQWITDPQNMLAWRSIVNRVWHWHFGRGIVETLNDFGRMGTAPSHPELLGWLACEFRDSGGSFKRLHRLIVMSAAYRQHSSGSSSSSVQLSSQTRRRLDAEQLRDSLLAVSGQLDLTMGGPSAMQFDYSDPNPSVTPRINYEAFDPNAPSSRRRGIYRFLFRNINDSLLEAFDAVDPSLSTPRRNETITALQALSLYNNRFVLSQCEHLAARLEREAASIEARIDRACLLLFGHAPEPEISAELVAYATRHGLANACRVLINSNEFLFVN